jgi:hypothetical protein
MEPTMATIHPILRVKPDPRGRLALGKAIEALNRRLSTVVSGFDVLMNDDGSLLLKPTVEVPAETTIVLNRTVWVRFLDVINDDAAPNAALRRAAEQTARDQVSKKPTKPPLASPTGQPG